MKLTWQICMFIISIFVRKYGIEFKLLSPVHFFRLQACIIDYHILFRWYFVELWFVVLCYCYFLLKCLVSSMHCRLFVKYKGFFLEGQGWGSYKKSVCKCPIITWMRDFYQRYHVSKNSKVVIIHPAELRYILQS